MANYSDNPLQLLAEIGVDARDLYSYGQETDKQVYRRTKDLEAISLLQNILAALGS